ncbi:MAG TPA: hypothetical protein VJ280_00225, partial [Dehalococcoidales bacterium]|nr:hypothetical protein [Dehalococcoidales bacterium]
MFDFLKSTDPLTKWLVSGGIVVIALLLAFLSKYIIGAIVKPFTKKTKTIIDDLIIEAVNAPIFAAIIAGGLWVGINRILTDAKAESIVNKIF